MFEQEEEMIALSPAGYEIVATAEQIYGEAIIVVESFRQNDDGSLDFNWEGYTEIDWNSQITLEKDGKRVFIDSAHGEWCEDELVLVPASRVTTTPAMDLLIEGFRRNPSLRKAHAILRVALDRESKDELDDDGFRDAIAAVTNYLGTVAVTNYLAAEVTQP